MCGAPFTEANFHRVADAERIADCASCFVCDAVEILGIVSGDPILVDAHGNPWNRESANSLRLFMRGGYARLLQVPEVE